MQCPQPIRLDNNVFVQCGKCMTCLKNKRDDWSIRLREELTVSESASFVTLTYDDLYLPYNLGFDKPAVQKFIKRLRKYSLKPIKYFLVSEYGTKSMRPHYHLLLFNYVSTVELDRALQKEWKFGLIHTGTVTSKSINYCCKYLINSTLVDSCKEKPFLMASKGLGKSYLEKKQLVKFHHTHKADYYPDSDLKLRLPRYYREKLFSKYERDLLNRKRQRENDSISVSKQSLKRKYDTIIQRDKRIVKSLKNNKL